MRRLALALVPLPALAEPKFTRAPVAETAEAAPAGPDIGGQVETALAGLGLSSDAALWALAGVVVLGLVVFGRARRPPGPQATPGRRPPVTGQGDGDAGSDGGE